LNDRSKPESPGKIINRTIMLSDHRRAIRRTCTALLCSALFLLPASLSGLLAAEGTYNARLIRQYVDEDKVNLLESVRQKFSRPSEKLVVEALLCEDGPKARALYQKQLREYPDPDLDGISSSRIAAYNLVLNNTAPPPKLSIAGPAQKPKFTGPKDTTGIRQEGNSPLVGSPVTPPAPPPQLPPQTTRQQESMDGYTLQFGSFGNIQNAETLARKVSYYSEAEIIRQNDIYRVRLKKAYPTREEAADAARQLPFDAIVIHSTTH
jgi:hypothetical protein